MSEEMDAGGRCEASNMLCEGGCWQIDQISALWKPHGPQGSPVHWDSMTWFSAANRLCRLQGVEMALAQGRSPASNWHEGKVDLRYLLGCEVWACVARIPTPVGALDNIAERGPTMTAPRMSPAVVVSGQNAYA